jgi:transcription termination factor NusB
MERSWQDYVALNSNIEGARASFEKDCEKLLRKMNPEKDVKVIRANPGDEGIDVYIGNMETEPIEIYQCKFFLSEIADAQKAQIRQSFITAMKSTEFEVTKWTVLMPLEALDIKESKWFDGWKAKMIKDYNLANDFIDLINGNILISLFKKNDLYNEVFKIDDSLKIGEAHKDIKEIKETISDINLLKDFERQLDEIDNDIKKYLTSIPLERLNYIEQAILKSRLSENDKNQLHSKCLFLKGLIQHGLDSFDEMNQYFIKAYLLAPNNLKYQEKAVSSFQTLGDESQALKISNEILKLNPYNGRAWAIKYFYDNTLNVPKIVQKDIFFRQLLSYLLINQDSVKHKGIVNKLFLEEINNSKIPSQIIYQELYFWVLVANLAFEKLMDSNPISYTHLKKNFEDIKLAKYSFDLHKKIIDVVINTDIFKKMSIKQLYFNYCYLAYTVNNDNKAILDLFDIYSPEIAEKLPYTLQELIVCLLQIEEFSKIIDLVSKYSYQSNEVNLLATLSYINLNQFEDSEKFFVKYLQNLKNIDDFVLGGIFLIIEHYEHRHISLANLHENVIQKLPFKDEIQRCLLETFCLKYETLYKEKVVKNLTDLDISSISSLTYKRAFLICFLAIQEWEKANILLETYVDKTKESPDLFAFIKTLYFVRKEVKQLLTLLKLWRENFSINYELLMIELEIYEQVQNYKKVSEVAEFAYQQFPNDVKLLYRLIQSLYLDRNDKVKNYINDSLLEFKLNWNIKFRLAQICCNCHAKELGLEIMYRLIKENPNIPKLKELYVSNIIIYTRDEVKEYEVVEKGHFVKIQTDNGIEGIEIDNETIINHPLASKLLGKVVGDEIEIQQPFNILKRKIQIIQILDKYQGILFLIFEEVHRRALTGMKMKSISIGKDIKEMFGIMIKEFGAEGEKEKMIFEDSLKKYNRFEFSFTELVRQISDNHPLNIYEMLTSHHGFRVLPLQHIKKSFAPLKNETRYVIDFTSLVILFKVSQDHPIILNEKFLISQYLLDHLYHTLQELNLRDDKYGSIKVTANDVIPIFAPPDFKSNEIEKIKNLIKWVENHCEVYSSEAKLAMIFENPDLLKPDDWYFNYLIDTIFIANESDKRLITDDLFLIKSFLSQTQLINVEYFLQEMFEFDVFKNKILPYLIKNNYLGITIYKENIINMFEDIYSGNFSKNLRLLSYTYHETPNVFFECLEFVKYLHSRTELSLQYVRNISLNIFELVLKGNPIIQDGHKIPSIVMDKFSLLGKAGAWVLQDLTDAMRIINESRK